MSQPKPRRLVVRAAWIALALLAAVQWVPYGHSHTNPPVVQEPAWDSPRTRELVVRACFDCHSNEVQWPWYSYVAPVSWLVQRDVEEARQHLNYSEWQRRQRHADDAAEEVAEGSMPPKVYRLMHSRARLNSTEVRALVAGLDSTFGHHAGGERESESGHDGS